MPSRRKRKLKIGNLIIVIVSLLVVCAGGFSLIHMIANKKDKTVPTLMFFMKKIELFRLFIVEKSICAQMALYVHIYDQVFASYPNSIS